jgi:hypothetical protein
MFARMVSLYKPATFDQGPKNGAGMVGNAAFGVRLVVDMMLFSW